MLMDLLTLERGLSQSIDSGMNMCHIAIRQDTHDRPAAMVPGSIFHLQCPPCLLSALLFPSGLTLRLSYPTQRTLDSTVHLQPHESYFCIYCHRNNVPTRPVCCVTLADSVEAFILLPAKAKQGDSVGCWNRLGTLPGLSHPIS